MQEAFNGIANLWLLFKITRRSPTTLSGLEKVARYTEDLNSVVLRNLKYSYRPMDSTTSSTVDVPVWDRGGLSLASLTFPLP